MGDLLGMFGDDADDVSHHLQETAADGEPPLAVARARKVPSPRSVMNGAWWGRMPTWPS